MVEQIQVTPPYESLVSSGISTPDAHVAAGQIGNQPTATNTEGDTVTLSASARANQLYLQGDSVAKISEVLGIPPATVESDLNIKAGTTSVQPTTAQAGSAQVTPADSGTPAHASASPYTAPVVTTEKVS
jgi:hypothetical protein